MNTERNRRYFTQRDLSIPMSIIGAILCGLIGLTVIFSGMYSSYLIYYFGFPLLLIGIFLLIFANSYYVKDRELDEEVAHELASLDERFRECFVLSDRDRDHERISASGFLFDREGVTPHRGRDAKPRSNFFYAALFLVTSDHFYALSHVVNLTDGTAAAAEQRVELRFSEITSIEHLNGANACEEIVAGGKLVIETAHDRYSLYVPDDAMIEEAVGRVRKKIAAQ